MIRRLSGLLGIALIGSTWANVDIKTTNTDVVIRFEAQSLQEPIGCIYIDDLFLSRLSPEDIQNGRCAVATHKLLEKLQDAHTCKISVIVEGFSARNLVRMNQTSVYNCNTSRIEGNFEFLNDSYMDNTLLDFIHGRFSELRRIRAKIAAEKALWIADLNSVFMLPDQDRARLRGFRNSHPQTTALPLQPSGRKRPPLPKSFDWTNKDGYNWMTPAKNQREPLPGAMTCWAFAAVGQVEALINIAENNPDLDLDLAEQSLVTDCCRYAGDASVGGWHFAALNYIKSNGLPLESVDPYTGANGPCDKRPSTVYKITSYTPVTLLNYDPDAIKSALLNNPLSTTVYASPEWDAYSGGIYCYTGAPDTVNHAVVFAGYATHPTEDVWKVKNSWGEDWGENGYIRIVGGMNDSLGVLTFDAQY